MSSTTYRGHQIFLSSLFYMLQVSFPEIPAVDTPALILMTRMKQKSHRAILSHSSQASRAIFSNVASTRLVPFNQSPQKGVAMIVASIGSASSTRTGCCTTDRVGRRERVRRRNRCQRETHTIGKIVVSGTPTSMSA